MRAAACTAYGRPREALEIIDLPEPSPDVGEVLVRVRAASLNPIDARKRAGYGRALFERRRRPLFPWILGGDCAGVVEAVGEGAEGFAPGDAVMAGVGPFDAGTHADLVPVRAAWLAPKPERLSFVEAAALPYAGLTAWAALTRFGGVAPGRRGGLALVNGASGGVGTVAVQLLKAWGWTVAATAAADAQDLLRRLGADCPIDYRAQDVTEALHHVDHVLDCVGDMVEGMERRCLSVLRPGGTYVTLVHPLARSLDRFGLVPGGAAAAALFARRRLAAGRARYRWALYRPDGAALAEMGRMVEAGTLTPVVDAVLPLEAVAEAHARVEAGGGRGKIVLDMEAQGGGA